jgi:hypothetical protein
LKVGDLEYQSIGRWKWDRSPRIWMGPVRGSPSQITGGTMEDGWIPDGLRGFWRFQRFRANLVNLVNILIARKLLTTEA